VGEKWLRKVIRGVKPYCNFAPSRINFQRRASDLNVNDDPHPVALRELLDQRFVSLPDGKQTLGKQTSTTGRRPRTGA
jgi:hypothetical protein